ncbi:MAG TPA: helix-turn-helix transcriptional regulator [Polyangiaceae bacterium]|nr:helix-turn-helix transcriptional regulator [Polyangiaceae bacterium]
MTTAHDYRSERRHATLTSGESLKIARELQGISQSELSRLTGIAQSAISAYEGGQSEIGIKRVKVLAAALRVHPAVIAFPDWQAEVIDLLQVLKRRRRSAPAAMAVQRRAKRVGVKRRAKR